MAVVPETKEVTRNGLVWLDNERQDAMGKRKKKVEGDAGAMVEMRAESGVAAGSWDRAERPRVDLHPTQGKLRWEAA